MLQMNNGVVYAVRSEGRFTIGLSGFFLIAFILSWIGAAPMVLTSWVDTNSPSQLKALLSNLAPIQLLMVFGTLIAALFVTFVNYGFAGLKSLVGAMFKFRVAPGWYVLTLLGPAVIVIAGLILSRRYDSALAPFSIDIAMVLATGQIFAVYLLLNTEEIAWRGYALPQLQRTMSPLNANLFLAMIWGVFHSPLFMMKGGHPAGYSIVIFALMVISIGLIAGYVFNATGGSVLIAHLLHQSFNAWGEGLAVFPMMNGGSPWPFRITVIIVAVLGLLAAIGLAQKHKPNLP